MSAHDQDSRELRDDYIAELAEGARAATRRLASALGTPPRAAAEELAEELLGEELAAEQAPRCPHGTYGTGCGYCQTEAIA